MEALDRPSIIIWSSDWTEVTGQSIVTRRVIEYQTNVKWINASYGRSGPSSIFGLFRAVVRAYFAILKGQSAIVYLVCSRSWLGFLRDLPALATRFIGVRVVVHVHGSDLNKLIFSSSLGPLARLLYRRCELVAPSTHLISDLHRITLGPVHLCENFVPMIPRQHLSLPVVDANKGPLVVWNSNIMASKGFFDLAEAVRLARSSIPSLRLIALGAPLRDSEMTYESARKSLSILSREPWFTYIGPVSPQEAFQWTAMADLYVYPSRNDCQPLAVVQAMCLGKPIIANDIAPLRATLDDYPAILLKAPGPQELAQAVRDIIIKGPPNGLSEAACKARTRFSPERFDRLMTAILLEHTSDDREKR